MGKIVEATCFSHSTRFPILQEKLNEKINVNVSSTEAVWVHLGLNPDEFLRGYIAVDEKWIKYYTLPGKGTVNTVKF